MTKTCPCCSDEKPLAAFRSRRGGPRAWCVQCQKSRSQEWEQFRAQRAEATILAWKRRRGQIKPAFELRMRNVSRSLSIRAVKHGKAPKRPDVCPKCQRHKSEAGTIEIHHHRGYNDPLDFIYLCRKCHGKEHRRINQKLLAHPYEGKPTTLPGYEHLRVVQQHRKSQETSA